MSVDERVRAEEEFGGRLRREYAGKWVAVEDHVVLDDDDNLRNLVERLNGNAATAEVFRVRDDPGAPCLP